MWAHISLKKENPCSAMRSGRTSAAFASRKTGSLRCLPQGSLSLRHRSSRLPQRAALCRACFRCCLRGALVAFSPCASPCGGGRACASRAWSCPPACLRMRARSLSCQRSSCRKMRLLRRLRSWKHTTLQIRSQTAALPFWGILRMGPRNGAPGNGSCLRRQSGKRTL